MDRYVMSEVPPHVRSQPEVLVRLFHGQVSCRVCAGRCTSSEELLVSTLLGKMASECDRPPNVVCLSPLVTVTSSVTGA